MEGKFLLSLLRSTSWGRGNNGYLAFSLYLWTDR
jgi:hypothetical protein